MSSHSLPSITTAVKMLESLPIVLQEKVVEQIREFLANLEDEEKWQASFEQTHEKLAASAQKARQEIAAGKASPMDYEQL